MIDLLALLGLRSDLFARGRPLAGDVLRFPPRAASAVWLERDREGGWVVHALGHGVSFGSREAAREAARELSENLGLPIREVVS